MNDHDINQTWFPLGDMTVIMQDNIEAVATEILYGKGVVPMPVPPSSMAVHPAELLDEDGQHDFELICTCPANLPDLWEDRRQEWARDVCSRARTRQLREYDPSRLVRNLLREPL
jgi:hypothetical protein